MQATAEVNPDAEDFERKVAVIGGGIAGITAAVKLYQQGFQVTLFEKADKLGGNLSSNSLDNLGDAKDVYPHIFADWYKEFWYLLEHDLKMPREDYFARHDTIRMTLPLEENETRDRFRSSDFVTLAAPTSIANVLANSQSGVLTPRDMMLFGQTFMDLVAVPSESKRSKMLNDLDVTGYLYSRPYMNDQIAGLHDDILKVIWSLPSDQTSAVAYQKLVRHTMTFPNATPFAWLLKGPLQQMLMDPIEAKLGPALAKTGGELRLGTEIGKIWLQAEDTITRKRPDQFVDLWIKGTEDGPPLRFRHVIVATQAKAACAFALNSFLARRHPTLARLREADTARIPVVYLYFKKKFREAHAADLQALPKDLTGFKRRTKPSKKGRGTNHYDISMINIATLWEKKYLKKETLYPNADDAVAPEIDANEPVLLLAASHATAIEFRGPEDDLFADNGRRQGLAMLLRFAEYFPFVRVGESWGNDKDSDIDWDRTRIVTNEHHQLFLNDVGGNEWRPYASLKNYQDRLAGDGEDPPEGVDYCKNVFFAGDYCMTDVDMATVEAATQSGVLAAQALLAEAGVEGHPVPLQPHDLYTTDALILSKLVTAPVAYASAVAATYADASQDPIRALTFPISTAVLSTAYLADWLRSAEQLLRFQIPGYSGSHQEPGGHRFGQPERHSGILQLGANLAVATIAEAPRVAPLLAETAAETAYSMWHGTVGRVLFPQMRSTLRDPKAPRRTQHRAPRRTGEQPRTWGELIQYALGDRPVTARSLSDGAFGIVATILHYLKETREPAAQSGAAKTGTTKEPVSGGAATGSTTGTTAGLTTTPADAPKKSSRKPKAKPEDRWTAATKQGEQAVRDRADGYREYPVQREL